MASCDPEPGALGTPTDPALSPAPEPDRGFLETFQLRTCGGRGGAADGPPAPLAALPLRVGHYVIEGVLGAGAFGLVCAARDVLTGARAAVKLVAREDRDRVTALHREAEWLASVNRPNIVKLFAQGEDHGYAWIATELVEGQSLAQVIANGEPSATESDFTLIIDGETVPSTEGEARDRARPASRRQRRARSRRSLRRAMTWFRDLALALHDVHQLDVVHRDIKPANIVIHRGGTPYLIDFGLGISEFDAAARDLYLEGTLPYMSPEQASGGFGGIGARSDLYSLAVTFHEALCGRRVVRSRYRRAILKEVIHAEVPPPSCVDRSIPASLDPIFVTALSKDEDARYPDGATLAADIDAWLEDRPLPWAPTPWSTRCRRLVRRRADVIVPLVLVILAAGTSWFLKSCDGGRAAVIEELSVLLQDSRRDDPAAQDRALALCLERADLFVDDRESRFWALYRSVAERSGDRRIEELLRFQAVAVRFALAIASSSESDAASGEDAPRGEVLLPMASSTRLARITSDALAHHRNLPKDPGFRFIAAFGLHLHGRDHEALALLPAEIGAGRVLEEELRALCYLSLEGSESLYQRTVSRIEARSPADAHFNRNDYCLAASRELERGIRIAASPEYGPEPAQECLSRARKLTALVLMDDPHHAVGLVLCARIDLEQGRIRRALQGFELAASQVEKVHGTMEDKIGTWFFIGLATLLLADDAEAGPHRQDPICALATRLEPALQRYPSLAGDLLHELNRRAAYDGAYLWVREVLRNPACSAARVSPRFLSSAWITQFYWARCLPDDLDAEERWKRSSAVVEKLGVRLLALLARDLLPGARDAIAESQTIRLIWAAQRIKELGAEERYEEGTPLAQGIVELGRVCEAHGLPLNLDALRAIARGRAHLALHGGVDQRPAQRAEALRLLREVHRKMRETLTDPKSGRKSEREREALRADMDEVERLEGVLGSRSPEDGGDPESETHHGRDQDPP